MEMNATSDFRKWCARPFAVSVFLGLIIVNLVSSPASAGDLDVSSQSGSSVAYKAIRFDKNPIIYPGMAGLEGADGQNINGPSLIRVPAWVTQPLGKYYLYFAHHNGKYIRLAYADKLEGPWKIHSTGVLSLSETPGKGHIASPDVHVDMEHKEIRMYFHQPCPKGSPISGQVSFVALSQDGLRFVSRPEVLGKFYFRVVQHRNWYYAFAKNDNQDGIIYRSKDGLKEFAAGPHYITGVRHTAMWIEKNMLFLVYTKVGETPPERILLSTIDLTKDWRAWKVSDPQILIEPEKDYEGVRLPLRPSNYGAVRGPVRQLRDPAIYEEDGLRYLLYSVAGEQGIAVAKLERTVR
jgi:hypothetical protein